VEIHKRSSHGRGEYELAGAVSGLSTSDLLDLSLVIDTESSLGTIETGVVVRSQGGKPRLRLTGQNGIHIQRQIEALLLMPKSTRDETQLVGGQPVVLADRYVLRRVAVVDAQINGSIATLKLGAIDCINDSGTHQIDFKNRIRDILRLYDNAMEFPIAVSSALSQHKHQVTATHSVGKSTEVLVKEIIRAAEEAARDSDAALIVGEDPVPLLLDLLRSKPTIEIPPISEIDPTDIEIRRRVADRWRMQKDRGPASAKFRREVRLAYRSTCLFCGLCLPTSETVRLPGVDAAHIVPWSQFDADMVSNGLCLCKLHHWAFDQYLLAIKHDAFSGYEIVVTQIARVAFASEPSVIASLQAVSGPINIGRLPDNPADWPRPQFLSQLYEDLRVDL
jgi:putative restriction endonuclease